MYKVLDKEYAEYMLAYCAAKSYADLTGQVVYIDLPDGTSRKVKSTLGLSYYGRD